MKKILLMPLLAASLGSPAFSQIPEPDPNDTFAVIDWVLESNGCTATEEQIYEAISSRTDFWTANIVIVGWGKDPNFSRDYRSEVGPEGGVVYTMISGPRCGG